MRLTWFALLFTRQPDELLPSLHFGLVSSSYQVRCPPVCCNHFGKEEIAYACTVLRGASIYSAMAKGGNLVDRMMSSWINR